MKTNKGLFNKKRFEWLEEKKLKYLNGLSIEDSVKMTEELVSFANELRTNFLPDNPLCLKIGLQKFSEQ